MLFTVSAVTEWWSEAFINRVTWQVVLTSCNNKQTQCTFFPSMYGDSRLVVSLFTPRDCESEIVRFHVVMTTFTLYVYFSFCPPSKLLLKKVNSCSALLRVGTSWRTRYPMAFHSCGVCYYAVQVFLDQFSCGHSAPVNTSGEEI